MRQQPAALRDFSPVYVRFGSFASVTVRAGEQRMFRFPRDLSSRVTASRRMLTRAAISACEGGGETTACPGLPVSGRDKRNNSA